MAGRTICEKILARKSGQDARAGGLVVCEVDCVLGTDGSDPMTLDDFKAMDGETIRNTGAIRDGDILISDGLGAIRNERTGETLRPEPLPPIMLAIPDAGGLVPYMRQNGDFKL